MVNWWKNPHWSPCGKMANYKLFWTPCQFAIISICHFPPMDFDLPFPHPNCYFLLFRWTALYLKLSIRERLDATVFLSPLLATKSSSILYARTILCSAEQIFSRQTYRRTIVFSLKEMTDLSLGFAQGTSDRLLIWVTRKRYDEKRRIKLATICDLVMGIYC